MPLHKRATQEELRARIGAWNQCYSVGTEVRAERYPERIHKTRTAAMILFDQKPVIYLEGFNGYFDLHEVQALQSTADASSSAVPSRDVPAPAHASKARAQRVVGFPGQGAQAKGMGAGLFPDFPELVQQADRMLGYSIERLCLEDPEEQLNLTQYTQVALYVVNALGYLQRKQHNDPAVAADFLMGHSLGEYNALLAAGVFDFETGLRLVMKRGALMAAANGGAMAAVLFVGAERIREVLAANGLDSIDFANYNTPAQTVISGPADAVSRAVDLLAGQNIQAVPLRVSAAFHSRYMRAAQEEFAQFIATFSFRAPELPVIANATARPYEPDRIAQTLGEQISSPVRWAESVRYVLGMGEIEFTEIGGTILTRMLKEIAMPAATAMAR
jgi:trans-AT polyketide synthase, acyltransferase and oxidoreductase domains